MNLGMLIPASCSIFLARFLSDALRIHPALLYTIQLSIANGNCVPHLITTLSLSTVLAATLSLSLWSLADNTNLASSSGRVRSWALGNSFAILIADSQP